MNQDKRVKFAALSPITSEKQVVERLNTIVNTLIPLVGQHSNKYERVVQWSDLMSMGLANVKGLTEDGYPDYEIPTDELPDMTTPPEILNFEGAAGFNFVTLSWDPPRYRNHSYVEVWRAAGFKKVSTDPEVPEVPTVLTDAVFRLMTPSIVCSDSVLPGDKWRYWARNVSQTGVVGPWTSIDGLLMESPEDPAYLIEKISGEIREGDLYPALGDKIDSSYVGMNANTEAILVVRSDLQDQANELLEHGTVLAQHTQTISAQGASISQQAVIIEGQGNLLSQHTLTLTQHGNSITTQSQILTTHEATLVSHGQSLATQNAAISNLTSITTSHGTTLAQHTSQITTANASISSVSQIVTGHGVTLAEHTQTLSAHGTAIQQQTTINTNQGNLINAAWTVRIDSGNAVSGFGLMVNGSTGRSDFIIRADRFAIAAPQAYDQSGKPIVNTAAFPFIVDVTNPASPKVLIKNAYIDQAYITSLVTGSLIADKIVGQTITGTNIRGGTMAVGSNFSVDGAGNMTALNAFFRGTAQSSNYGAGVSGWQIHNNGNAEFNNAVLRGTIYATGGWFQGTVYAEKMVGGVYSYAGKDSQANSGVTTVGQWVRAFVTNVVRGMAISRFLRVTGPLCRIGLWLGGTGSGGTTYQGSATFVARLLRDGAVVATKTVTLSGISPGAPYPSGSTSYADASVFEIDFLTAVPTDGNAHAYEVQYQISSVNPPAGGDISASVSTNPTGTPVTYRSAVSLFINTGDLT